MNRFHSWHSKWSKWISFRLVIRQLPDIVFIHVYPCLSLHIPGAANAALRLLYQFLSNKAEKGQSSTTEVKVTLEHMYNGLLDCEALSDNPSRLTISWISHKRMSENGKDPHSHEEHWTSFIGKSWWESIRFLGPLFSDKSILLPSHLAENHLYSAWQVIKYCHPTFPKFVRCILSFVNIPPDAP